MKKTILVVCVVALSRGNLGRDGASAELRALAAVAWSILQRHGAWRCAFGLWRASREERSSWSTPLAVEHDGRTEIIVSATNRVRSYDPATGKMLWESGGLASFTFQATLAGNVSSPRDKPVASS